MKVLDMNILKNFLKKSSFKHIVFLSMNYQNRGYWKEIANSDFKNIDKDFIASSDNKFFITHHNTYDNYLKVFNISIMRSRPNYPLNLITIF